MTMIYRKLGKSGLPVSVFSFGSWVTYANQVDDKLAVDLMSTAYDAGVNFFDNAEVYANGESEIIMGRALKKLGWSRDTYSVSSKVFFGGGVPTNRGLHRKHVYEACEAALKRLQVDYLDLYFCHRPDDVTPVEETVWTMTNLIQQGKVFYWGTSEWTAQQIMEAHMVARQYNLIPPTMEQPQYNMFERQKVEVEYRRLFSKIGMGATIWSPLAYGILTGKYDEGIPENSRASLAGFEWIKDRILSEEGERKLQAARDLKKVADELGCSRAQLALAWCASNENVSTVILGASKVTQLEENLKALDVLPKMTSEVLSKIEEVIGTKPKADETFG